MGPSGKATGSAFAQAALWDPKAKIIYAHQLKDFDFKSPVVVSCTTTEECDTARRYYVARGSPMGATFVDLSGTGDKAMNSGATGPRLADAAVKEEIADAPKRRALPQGVTDDQSLATKGGETAYLRLQVPRPSARARSTAGRRLARSVSQLLQFSQG